MINLEILQIVIPALLAGLMISFVHGSFGVKVLNRGIIFIDIAIAQIAGLGIVVGQLFFSHLPYLILQLIILSFAFLAGLFFYYIEKKMPKQQEAIIGCSFIFAASMVNLLFAGNPHGGDEITHLLSGQMLFISWHDLALHFPIYLLIFALWFLKPKLQSGVGFYLLFALAITSSVQLVGVYVVFASLILPALCAVHLKNKLPIVWLCGVLSIVSGVVLAMILDLPAGGLVVLSYFFWTIALRLVMRFFFTKRILTVSNS